jgi:hypothetical protein
MPVRSTPSPMTDPHQASHAVPLRSRHFVAELRQVDRGIIQGWRVAACFASWHPLCNGLYFAAKPTAWPSAVSLRFGNEPVETGPPPSKTLRVAITGSSGLVGTSLREDLAAQGQEFLRLVRRQPRVDLGEIHWSPESGEIDAAGLEGVDAVVHLAGENIFGRWTKAKKERIRESRRHGTQLLSRTLAELVNKPNVLISASAVAYYGDTGDRTVDESSPSQEGFLADVCRTWEDATRAATQAGIRTVRLRLGIVLSSRGGALEMMRTPFRLGLGGRLGSGHQYMSWIHLEEPNRTPRRKVSPCKLAQERRCWRP